MLYVSGCLTHVSWTKHEVWTNILICELIQGTSCVSIWMNWSSSWSCMFIKMSSTCLTFGIFWVSWKDGSSASFLQCPSGLSGNENEGDDSELEELEEELVILWMRETNENPWPPDGLRPAACLTNCCNGCNRTCWDWLVNESRLRKSTYRDKQISLNSGGGEFKS